MNFENSVGKSGTIISTAIFGASKPVSARSMLCACYERMFKDGFSISEGASFDLANMLCPELVIKVLHEKNLESGKEGFQKNRSIHKRVHCVARRIFILTTCS